MYMSVCMYVCVYIYIYIHRRLRGEREARLREKVQKTYDAKVSPDFQNLILQKAPEHFLFMFLQIIFSYFLVSFKHMCGICEVRRRRRCASSRSSASSAPGTSRSRAGSPHSGTTPSNNDNSDNSDSIVVQHIDNDK